MGKNSVRPGGCRGKGPEERLEERPIRLPFFSFKTPCAWERTLSITNGTPSLDYFMIGGKGEKVKIFLPLKVEERSDPYAWE